MLRYRDSQGNVCAFYDSTLLFPKDVLFNAAEGLGVVVLDMNDPAKPREDRQPRLTRHGQPARVAARSTQKRGLLAGVLGNAATNVGILDVYDVKTDCRHPKLLSSTPSAVLGHESGFAPDGKTFYASSAGGPDAGGDRPHRPGRCRRPIFQQFGVNYHGLRLSDDGRTMYVANIGNPTNGAFSSGGLRILDISEIQDREAESRGPGRSSDVTWSEHSIPQVAEPFTAQRPPLPARGRRVRELQPRLEASTSRLGSGRCGADHRHRRPAAPEGGLGPAARRSTSPAPARATSSSDPGALSPVQGYAAPLLLAADAQGPEARRPAR